MNAIELKAKVLMYRRFSESEHCRDQANTFAKALFALTGEVLIGSKFVVMA